MDGLGVMLIVYRVETLSPKSWLGGLWGLDFVLGEGFGLRVLESCFVV